MRTTLYKQFSYIATTCKIQQQSLQAIVMIFVPSFALSISTIGFSQNWLMVTVALEH